MANLEIWQPRWHDRKVLLAQRKISEHNYITFTKAPSLEGKWYISGNDVRKFPLGSNGKIMCYEVPLDELKLLEEG